MKFTVPDETEQITVKQFLRKNCEMSARTLAKLKRCENGIMLGTDSVFKWMEEFPEDPLQMQLF